jgi:flagellum-specific peptidoglycan hydrolase FlgJ
VTPDIFIPRALTAAYQGMHMFPEFAVCEAALESAWGGSELAIKANNLFGQKQSHQGAAILYPILELPTKEWDAGQLVSTVANWPIFPDWPTSFMERMQLLARLAPAYPHYAAALAATDGETFIREVSQTWSTDPQRANKVLAIYNEHQTQLEVTT